MKALNSIKYLAVTSLLTVFGISSAAVPNGYYNGLEGKSGVTLKKAVKAAARNHTAIPYSDGTWEVFLESDTHIVGSQRCWWDMYSNDNVAAPNSSSHSGLNVEHGVPNSWWGKTKNDAYKDLFHLNPSNADANNRKGNYPLGEISTMHWNNGVTFVGKPGNGTGDDATYVFEPADEYKGDFARAYFYMFTIYDDIAWTSSWDWMYNSSSDLLLKPWAYEMLLRWAKADPVSQKEKDRNEVIYKHQKNRNPFIDYPELAEYIWGSKKNTPFHLDGSTDPDPDPEPGIDPDPVEPSPVPSGFWYAVTSTSDLNETDRYVLVATEAQCAMSSTFSSKYFQVSSVLPTYDGSVTPARLSKVPEDVAVIRLTKNGAGWILGVSDLSCANLGYISSTSAKTLVLTQSASANGTTANISASDSKTVISYGSAGNLEYNAAAPRFLTYTSGQEPVRLYRLEEENRGGDIETGIGFSWLHENEDEVIYGIYDINGRRMPAEAVSELDNGIYIVVSNFGTRKILR